MQINCHQISNHEFKCFTEEHQDQTNHPCYGLGDGAGMGIPLALVLITSGIYVPITYAKRTYENLKALDEKGNSSWSRLNTCDKLKSVVEPLLMTGAGLLAISGGVVIGYVSVSGIQECYNSAN